MKKFLIGLALAAASMMAQAATYYVCDCQSGADASCVAGDDTRTGATAQNAATPLKTWAGVNTRVTRAGGDVFRFCRGGAWLNDMVTLHSFTGTTSRCSKANPCTWESYTPSWLTLPSSTVTISNASPAVVTWNAHGLSNGDQVKFSTTGSLPAGIQPGITYYVLNAATNTFQVSRAGPTGVNRWAASTTTAGSGTHTATKDLRPKRYMTTSNAAMSANDGSNLVDGGYIIRDLHLIGASTSGPGIQFYYDVDDVHISNMEIAYFSNGVYPYSRTTLWHNDNYTLRDSYLHHNRGSAWLGGARRLVIENNWSHNNGETTLDHEWYFSEADDVVFRSNVMFDPVDLSTGDCGGSVVVVHGIVNRMLIEGNYIKSTQTAGTGCYGIEFDNGGYGSTIEVMRDVVVRGNHIINVGYIGIAFGIATRPIIEDNVIVWDGGSSNKGWKCIADRPGDADDIPSTQVTIRNNTCYINSTTGNVPAASVGVDIANLGTGHVITNNLIVFGANRPTSSACFKFNSMPAGSFTKVDNNLCYSFATATVVYDSTAGSTWATRATGFDTNGVNADPLFVATPADGNGFSAAVQAGSPAVNAGNTTYKSRLSFGNKVPNGARDIGAYDYGATVTAPYGPASARTQ